ncbi:MAG: acetyl-CoA synthetase [Candidatus Heimdallarchaeota archaeon]|nr:acetyl-CoA synthetase [Candidatus Heimdallarchaeota archaeon]
MNDEITKVLELCASQGRTVLSYEESRNVLSFAGFPLNKMAFAKNLEECLNKAHEIGYPIVLKVVSEDVLHKSDSGGVKINIGSDEELKKAHEEMVESVKNFYPSAKITGFSIEEMVEGVELLIGTNTDEQFGKMIAFGIGGIFVEVYKDVSFRLIPVNEDDILEMIAEIKGKKMLDGYRGQPKVDQSELISFVLGISNLIETYPQIKEMDLNPVVATLEGLKAIDARIILE